MASSVSRRVECVPRPMAQDLAPTEESWMNQPVSTGVRCHVQQ